MSRKKELHTESVQALPPDLSLLLDEIEREAVPEKLLALAMKLQDALAEKRLREGIVQASPTDSGNLVKQP